VPPGSESPGTGGVGQLSQWLWAKIGLRLHVSAALLKRRIERIEDKTTRFGETRVRWARGGAASHHGCSTRPCAPRCGIGCLCGPAGIGKTRLLDEAATRAALSGMQVVRVRCQAADTLRPLSGLMELIPRLLSLPGAAGVAPENLKRLRAFAEIPEQPSDETSGNPVSVRRGLCIALLRICSTR